MRLVHQVLQLFTELEQPAVMDHKVSQQPACIT